MMYFGRAKVSSDFNKEDLIFKNDVYYLKTENDTQDGPFCSCCADYYKKLIRLHKIFDENGYIKEGYLICPKCNFL